MVGVPAATASEQAPLIDSAAIVEQVREDLAGVGIDTAPVDTAVTDAVDRAVASIVPEATAANTTGPDSAAADTPYAPATNPNPLGLGQTPPAAGQPVSQETGAQAAEGQVAQVSDPNYRWRSDLSSKLMAANPTADHVLHRVPGSWFDAPRIPEESVLAQNQGKSLYGPGTPLYIGESKMCTLGVVGTDAQGRKVGLTAGHCGEPGELVASADSWQVGPSGTVVASNAAHDYSVIEFGSNAELTRSYNGVTVNEVGGAPVTLGQQLCKQGVATGFTCGITWAGDGNTQLSQVCASVGDSGGPVLAGNRLVGLVSGGSLPDPNLACRTPLQGVLFMPTVSTSINAVLADLEASGGPGAGFVLAE
ncbi:hypothetical protein A605_03915 [Corynebacterium halotolerans YIM 70093 = DSM 44683]|uniref:Serine protease n=1 Tax=Corynebacterium halotolerans YIM 70093 = DSM 44683 TaxID=1121362 RepID=M1MVN3_9CORY|nr:hypothetical protein A605_03915 [Corynebacterium halotolerans YIM 70093 = DSM 44683]